MRKGKVLSVYYYTNIRWEERMPSVNITVLEEFKLFGIFPIIRLLELDKYGYFQRDIEKGDVVIFEKEFSKVTALAKLENKNPAN